LKKLIAEDSKTALLETVLPMVCICIVDDEILPLKYRECCRNHGSIKLGCFKCCSGSNLYKHVANQQIPETSFFGR